MARFDKLEFDDGDDAESPQLQEPQLEKDEHYWAGLASSHRCNGNYENALRFYSRSLEIEKRLIDAWVGQVQMLVLLGEYRQASMWAQKALELFPNHGDLLAGRAQAECRQGNQSEAFSLSDGALSQRGETAYQWQVRGELMVAGKQKTDVHCFDKAQIACSDHIVPLESGLIYIYHRIFVKAQTRLNAALEKKPDSYYAWYLIGVCQQKTGRDEAALRSFERCRELCPNHHDARLRIAEIGDGWRLGRRLRRMMQRKQ